MNINRSIRTFLSTSPHYPYPCLKQILISLCHIINCAKQRLILATTLGLSKIKPGFNRPFKNKSAQPLLSIPWYLILGRESVGKHSALRNMNLDFMAIEQIDANEAVYLNQLAEYNLWIAKEALLVSPLAVDIEQDRKSWTQLLNLLQKKRRYKPLNGIIIFYSLADLLVTNGLEHNKFITDIGRYVKDITQQFQCQIPIYILFTKCDLVAGFSEFFSHITKDDLYQSWGMTFPTNTAGHIDQLLSYFNDAYQDFLANIHGSIMSALDAERNEQGRELIFNFPHQLQLLKQPIENFIVRLVNCSDNINNIQLRGMFFTSSEQTSNPHDFLLKAMSEQFKLEFRPATSIDRISECYFLKHIMHQHILSEAPHLGSTYKYKRMRRYISKMNLMLLPLLFLITSYLLIGYYQQEQQTMNQLDNRLELYQLEKQKISPADVHIKAIEPLMSIFNQLKLLYPRENLLTSFFHYSRHQLKTSIQHANTRIITNLILPRLAAKAERSLVSVTNNKPLIYILLKAYLSFDATPSSMSPLTKVARYYELQNKSKDSEFNNNITSYLTQLLPTDIPKLPLDYSLIQHIKQVLASSSAAPFVYNLIEFEAQLNTSAEFRENYTRIQHMNDAFAAPPQLVSSLYTKDAVQHLFVDTLKHVTSELSYDNIVKIPNNKQFKAYLHTNYLNHYIKSWQTFLNTLKIKQITTLPQAIDLLDTLSVNPSPIFSILSLTQQHTYHLDPSLATINQAFSKIHQYLQISSTDVNWQQTQSLLVKLLTVLNHIQSSTDIDKQSYLTLRAMIQHENEDLHSLWLSAQVSPFPVNNWVQDVVIQCWNIINQHARQYINRLWKHQVHHYYIQHLNQRYPLSISAKQQLGIEDFEKFFATDGITDHFISQYLAPFIERRVLPTATDSYINDNPLLSEQSVRLIQKLASIKERYFHNGQHIAEINFAVKPLMLNNESKAAKLSLGHQAILYQHGPQVPRHFSWPLTGKNLQAAIEFIDFNNVKQVYSIRGPWSLFKLIDKGQTFATTAEGDFKLRLTLKRNDMQFLLSSNLRWPWYTISQLKGLTIPTEIAN